MVGSAAPDPGSFRDPLSRVFTGGTAVYRGLTDAGLEDFEAFATTAAFRELQEEGKLVATERMPAIPAEVEGSWAAVLRHDAIPTITYPYEWSFSMLRDAALLQLEVTARALAEGVITKDASAYNIQFVGTRPTFIDVGSFEKVRPGEPWPGYGQLCQQFLNPLVLQAVTGVPFQPWLRGALEGITPGDLAPLLKGRRRFDRRLGVHVRLHARASRRYADAGGEVRRELKQAGFGPAVIKAQLANLERTIRSLRWEPPESTWSGYTERAHYVGDDLQAKDDFVAGAVTAHRPGLVLDVGANDGRFSELALKHGAGRAVAVDADQLTIDQLYRRLRERGEDRITPLVIDLADPSPARGWQGRERGAFTTRIRPDLVLSLAVIHHLAISNTVPFELLVDDLAAHGAPVVVELPHREDPMVATLLSRKRTGLFDHYDRASWEEAFRRRFEVVQELTLPSGHRTLYHGTPR